MMDFDVRYDNRMRIDVNIGHLPGGTSTKNMRHWKQMLDSGEFKKFDYGEEGNL